METFLIPPEDCVILKAFQETQSLREASLVLGCDPAGLARKVKHISSEYGLIQKINNRWQLTSKGHDLVAWTDQSIQGQKNILHGKSQLKMASNGWLIEALIPNINKLCEKLDKMNQVFLFTPEKTFEAHLIEGSADFVLACHPPESADIEFRKLVFEEWVIILPRTWNVKSNMIVSELANYPFVRHNQLKIDQFIPKLDYDKLKVPLVLDNLMSIKKAVESGIGWSIVPKILVSHNKNDQLIKCLPFKFPISDRSICLWWLRNRFEMRKLVFTIEPWLKKKLMSS